MRTVPLTAYASGPQKRGPKGRAGFTLIEMSVVLVIVAVITGSVAVMGNRWIEAERYRITNRNLDVIEQSLFRYIQNNERLPCPGDLALAYTDANYGKEAANPGTCTGGSPAATFSYATTNTVQGTIPADELDIPRSLMTDGWGNRYVYSVDRRMTGANIAASSPVRTYPEDESVAIGTFTVNARLTDGTLAARNTTPTRIVYTIFSAGPNGHGAYLPNGTRYFSGSTDADEWENCSCNATAATTFANAASAVFVQSSPNASFDDILRYKRRSQLYKPD